jgi:deoxyribose-phosphate aldolase
VAAGFPSGQYPLETRLEEVRCAIRYGAQEIDVVIDRSLVLNHDWVKLYEELAAIRKVCNENQNTSVCLKVILSSGELFNLKDIYKASMVALFAGANFIKTSTGKDTANATLPMGIVMCRAIKEYERLTTKKVQQFITIFMIIGICNVSITFRWGLNLPEVLRLQKML